MEEEETILEEKKRRKKGIESEDRVVGEREKIERIPLGER